MTARRIITTTFVSIASATVLWACGGGTGSNTSGTSTTSTTTPPNSTATGTPTNSSAAAATVAPKPSTGKTAKVQMVDDNERPGNVTIKVGDAVQWTNVSGGPHNISFWPDSIPSGSQDQLAANMPAATGAGPAQKLGPLVGPLLTAANDTYTVSFAGLKPGVYKYYCTPHLALGMKGTVTVQ
jgi:plastocyanin